MRVQESLIEQQTKLIFSPKDKNLQFLQLVDTFPPQHKLIIPKQPYYKKVINKVSELEFDEMLEWTDHICTKVKNTMKRVRVIKGSTLFGQKLTQKQMDVFSAFRDSVRLLVSACASFQIQYDTALIQEVIKQFYYGQYGLDMLAYFCAVDYDCFEYHLFPPRKRISLECCQPAKVIQLQNGE